MPIGGYHQTLAPAQIADEPSITLTTTYKALIPTIRYTEKLGSAYFDACSGRRARLRAFGRLSTSTSPGNLQVGILWGTNGDNNGTILQQSAAKALTASIGNASWELDVYVHTHAITSGSGTNGKLFCSGKFLIDNSIIANTLQPILIPGTAAAEVGSLDLTGSSVPSIQMLASAGASIIAIVHDFFIEDLGF